MKINDFLQKNKILTCLLIGAVILIIIGLGGLTYKYITNENGSKLPIDNNEPLITKNKFSLKEINYNKEERTKEIKVGYNGKNHLIRIKVDTTKEEDYYKIGYQIYIDNELIHTANGGNAYLEHNMLKEGFDGYIYVIDSKYLAVILPDLSIATTPGYKLTFYNDKLKTDEDIQIIEKGKLLCEDKDCNKIISDIEDIEFNGTTIKYWYQECEQQSNVKYEVGFDGQKVTKNQIKKANNMYKKGVIGC